jgi:hypothetical protein
MRFPMPHFPTEFEIPDEWLLEAWIIGFTPRASAYRSTARAVLVPLTQIEPAPRLVTHPKDWHGFERVRLICLLKGFVAGDEIEPVSLCRLPALELGPSPYRYRVAHGVHRYYGSIAAGYEQLPALI